MKSPNSVGWAGGLCHQYSMHMTGQCDGTVKSRAPPQSIRRWHPATELAAQLLVRATVKLYFTILRPTEYMSTFLVSGENHRAISVITAAKDRYIPTEPTPKFELRITAM